MSISYICMIMRSNQCWQNAKYIGGSCRAIEGKAHIVHYIKYSSFYKITLALALPKDHNPVNTTFFWQKGQKHKEDKKDTKRQKSHLRWSCSNEVRQRSHYSASNKVDLPIIFQSLLYQVFVIFKFLLRGETFPFRWDRASPVLAAAPRWSHTCARTWLKRTWAVSPQDFIWMFVLRYALASF